jgi:hypothetical protein
VVRAYSEFSQLKKKAAVWFFGYLFLLILNPEFLLAQSLPLGTPVIEDYYLRKQLNGELDPTISFTIRPVFPFLNETNNRNESDTLLNLNIFETNRRIMTSEK